MTLTPSPASGGSTHPNPLYLATIDGKAVPQKFRLTVAEKADTYRWNKFRDHNLDQLATICTHVAQTAKDGPCYVPATFAGDRRTLQDVVDVCALVYDIDGAMSLDDVRRHVRAFGRAAFVYTTYSHRGTKSYVKTDLYEAWAKKALDSGAPSLGSMTRYLAEKKPHLKNICFDGGSGCWEKVAGVGNCYIVEHDPVDKCRVMVPLATPIQFGKLSPNNKECNRIYRAIYFGVAEAIGFGDVIDRACADPTHLFYEASCPEAMKGQAVAFQYEGLLLDYTAVAVSTREEKRREEKIAKSDSAPRTYSTDKGHVVSGLNLKAWLAQYASTFDIEKLMEARGLLKRARDEGGAYCECHQEDAHTSTNDERTWAANGREGKGFVLYCHGAGGEDVACKDIDRLDKIAAYILAGAFTVEDLQNRDYGGGPLSARAWWENKQGKHGDAIAIDKNGCGVDCVAFLACVRETFDFPGLAAGCKVQINGDLTAGQLAEYINAGKITVEDLKCFIKATSGEQPTDEYEIALWNLAKEHNAGKLTARSLDKERKGIAEKFHTTVRNVGIDYDRFAKEASKEDDMPGLLDKEASALINPTRAYIDQFAIVNTGGKGVIMDLVQPDLSTAIMSPDAFELLHRHEWIELATQEGVKTIYPAKEFLKKPPRGVQVYDKLVFEPSGTVGAKEYNLFKGFMIEPDASGDCTLFYDLVRDVWCPGDPSGAEWVTEFYQHIFAHPGEKVRTALAIRGGYGDGKSFIAENLLSTILGDMLLRVANQRIVLGDFNESLVGKLLTVLEEAAFAGDKAAFDRLKEVVTGKEVLINPKFKAPFSVKNFTRLIQVSNHPHFMFMKAGDRRYTVLQSSDAWNGTDKFGRLMDQWNCGGASRFLYEAMNHSFRRFDDSQQLVINTNLKTEAGVEQIALSRSVLEKCVVQLVLHGDLVSLRSGEPLVLGETLDGHTLWPLDKEWKVESRDLEIAVTQWVREHGSREAAYLNLNTIIAAFEDILGKDQVGKDRPRAQKDGKRTQQPTVRLFPPRQQAILAAYRRGMLTDVEFGSVLDDDLKPRRDVARDKASSEEVAHPETA